MADNHYNRIAAELEAKWLREYHVSEERIANLRSLNTPTSVMAEIMKPSLHSQQEMVLYYLRQLDTADANKVKNLRAQLRREGFSLKTLILEVR